MSVREKEKVCVRESMCVHMCVCVSEREERRVECVYVCERERGEEG